MDLVQDSLLEGEHLPLEGEPPSLEGEPLSTHLSGVDFVHLLPLEITHLILKFISVNDLGRLLRVSKAWYRSINDDPLWRRHCQAYRVDPSVKQDFVRDEASSLCDWAQIWREFRTGPEYWFGHNRWETTEITYDAYDLFSPNFCDGNSIVFCTQDYLNFHRAADPGRAEHHIQFPFPQSNLLYDYAVCDECICVVRSNIVLIYKLCEQQFKCTMALAMDKDVFIKTFSSIPVFVRNRFIATEPAPRIHIMAFKEDCVWLREESCLKIFVLNLKNNDLLRLSSQNTHNGIFVKMDYHLLCETNNGLSVYNYSGRLLQNLTYQDNQSYCEGCDNKNLILICSEDKFLTFDPAIGRRFLSLFSPYSTSYRMHPTLNIIYLFDAIQASVTSMCAISGEKLWATKVPICNEIIMWESWKFWIVSNKYLLIIPSVGYNVIVQGVIIDVKEGSLVHKTMFRVGRILHVSDGLIITCTDKIYINNIFIPK